MGILTGRNSSLWALPSRYWRDSAGVLKVNFSYGTLRIGRIAPSENVLTFFLPKKESNSESLPSCFFYAVFQHYCEGKASFEIEEVRIILWWWTRALPSFSSKTLPSALAPHSCGMLTGSLHHKRTHTRKGVSDCQRTLCLKTEKQRSSCYIVEKLRKRRKKEAMRALVCPHR